MSGAGGLDGLGGGSIGMESTMMAQMMQDPNFAQYMSSMLQNPQVLESMFSMNPAMQAMGPEARAILRSPQFQQMISNPDTLQQIAQMNSQLGGSMAGGGSGMGLFGFNNPWPSPATMGNPFSAMGGAATATATGTGTGAGVAGNPMASFWAQQMGAMRATTASTGALHPSPSGQQQQRPEERFEVQLKQLNDMGFWDAAKNIRALQAAGGNVNSAIELLFSGSD
jgi:ubiquilin